MSENDSLCVSRRTTAAPHRLACPTSSASRHAIGPGAAFSPVLLPVAAKGAPRAAARQVRRSRLASP
jgi:hypothetical protein